MSALPLTSDVDLFGNRARIIDLLVHNIAAAMLHRTGDKLRLAL